MIKKVKNVILLSLMVLGLAVPQYSFAQSYYGLKEAADKTGYDQSSTVETSVQSVVSTLLALLAIIFFVLVTYAGIRWMTSRGNEEMAASAKSTLETAVIGLIIVMSAYAITSFIFSKLEGVTVEEELTPDLSETICAAFTTEGACTAARNSNCYWSQSRSVCLSSGPAGVRAPVGQEPSQPPQTPQPLCIDQYRHHCASREDCGDIISSFSMIRDNDFRCTDAINQYCCEEI